MPLSHKTGGYRMLRTIALIVVITSLSVSSAVALDGNKIHSLCSDSPDLPNLYVSGVLDEAKDMKEVIFVLHEAKRPIPPKEMALMFRMANGNVCTPDGVTIAQSRDIVCKHLKDHPATRHNTAASLVRDALEAAFPCNDEKK
jgi:hypothetical protein